ncbi:hypothetical protein STRTUCAR8_06871 [Streptomyces turgidiscabies Car8]|uniref:Uncharacterized protein n=1 Tax=Streptomyces turgidiscabies (strain Car8) TaxID=698760 RepID=L7EVB5_STRT8|nr:hypothetical protein STRTUCAR8_06871 [Streptomyces turgidiscabies Car8]
MPRLLHRHARRPPSPHPTRHITNQDIHPLEQTGAERDFGSLKRGSRNSPTTRANCALHNTRRVRQVGPGRGKGE